MKMNDIHTEKFPVEFNEENTLICGRQSSLRNEAVSQLKKLNSENHNVYITDPYMFPAQRNYDEQYEADLKYILKELKASKIIYCAKTVYDTALYQRVESELASAGCTLTTDTKLDDCHDRFWLCLDTDKCIVFGTSLNGIGRKISRIDELSKEEVEELKNQLHTKGVL